MPYHVVRNSSQCPSDKPHAVVKDDDDELMGCHETVEDAQAQIAALEAGEEEDE